MSGEKRQELQAIASTYQNMESALAENEELKVKLAETRNVAENFERQTQLLERDNDIMRREVKKARSERDHYFRAFTALSAQLDQVASGLVTAISQARVQAYGGRRPLTEVEKMAADRDLPSFLRSKPDDEQRVSPIDFKAFAASLIP